ncbi:hypothetical protein PMAYCL1PPCAC_08718 [Pristionchus mayeri]|uniref:Uncharacterized protein n=1 Tax=Pristionchus mayeri TaxID=1317129 RepID=A0AAN5C5S1_9BILA|nr:hypothetical protein PMAYCL1PPCAC_08718 [Pristionchus mayeri]
MNTTLSGKHLEKDQRSTIEHHHLVHTEARAAALALPHYLRLLIRGRTRFAADFCSSCSRWRLLVAVESRQQVARGAVALRSLRSLHSHRASAQSPPMERSHCRIRRLITLKLGECNLRPASLRAAEGEKSA